MLEGSTETVVTGVTLQAEGVGVVGDWVPAGGDQDVWSGEVAEKVSDDNFHGRCENECGTLFGQSGDETYTCRHVIEGFAQVAKATPRDVALLHVRR